MSKFVQVATLRDLPINSMKAVEVNGHSIALFNVDDEIHAVDNSCRACGTVLGEAIVTEDGVVCPHHGWSLDLDQGACPVCPDEKIHTYSVRIDGDTILVEL